MLYPLDSLLNFQINHVCVCVCVCVWLILVQHMLCTLRSFDSSHPNLSFYNPYGYIYILSAVALDETNISDCLHFSMKNIEMSCDHISHL